MDNYYVYALISPYSGLPFYIGKGSGTRYKHHLSSHRADSHENTRKRAFIDQCYSDNKEIKVEIIFNGSEEECFAKEASLIRWFGRDGYDKEGLLLNIACGGAAPPKQTGKPRSDETKKKISETRRRKGIMPTAGIAAAKIANTGRSPTNKGLRTDPGVISAAWEKRRFIAKLLEEGKYEEALALPLTRGNRLSLKKRIDKLQSAGVVAEGQIPCDDARRRGNDDGS